MFLYCLLLVSGIGRFVFAASDNLKVWSTCTNSSCTCGSDLHHAIKCSDDSLQIQSCYCMYYDQDENTAIAGNCLVSCFAITGVYYHTVNRYLVKNATHFNRDMCSPAVAWVDTHREGRFCGACAEGYGLAVYSYHTYTCIPCTDYGYWGWLRYFAVALLPLTLFYFLVVLLRINIPSSHLNGVVFVVQCALSPLQLRIIDGYIYALTRGGADQAFKLPVACGYFLPSLLGILNLDFFRTAYPCFCLHPKMNILHIASLDFIVALYPFVLIALTYILVCLHDKNNRLIVLAWRPFKWCLRCYQRQFNVKASLVEAFATFILLSSVKILGVCFDLLIPTKAYDETGSKLAKRSGHY